MQYKNYELEQLNNDVYVFYQGTKTNHEAWVTIKKNDLGRWYYIRLNNVSKSEDFENFNDCLEFAYNDMLRAKL